MTDSNAAYTHSHDGVPNNVSYPTTEKSGVKWKPSFLKAREGREKNLNNNQGLPGNSQQSPNFVQESPIDASVALPKPETYQLKRVEVDSLVLVKVIKHCRENYPSVVNGQLLGIDIKEKLEVTNCFPLPTRKDVSTAILKEKPNSTDLEEKIDEELEKYQDKMTELMHDVNIDCFTVGWYQTLSFGDLKSKEIIDSLILYQDLVDKAILLGFDPLLNAAGRMAFKAYHVSEKFLRLHRTGDVKKFNELHANEILVEIPLTLKNAPLVKAYLLEWAINDPLQTLSEFDTLELNHNNYLEKNLVSLSSSLESLMEEQNILQKYQREHVEQVFAQKQLEEKNKLENEQLRLAGDEPIPLVTTGEAYDYIEPPSQLKSLLLSNTASIQCKEVKNISSEGLAKMYLLGKSNTQKFST